MADPEPDHTCVCVVCEQKRHDAESSRLREAVRLLGRLVAWTPTTDPRITCLVCGFEACTHEIRIRDSLQTVWSGVHETCLNFRIKIPTSDDP